MIYYIMIVVIGHMNIGGKPNFSFYHNMPAFVPIMFECTVLFAAHLCQLLIYLEMDYIQEENLIVLIQELLMINF